jgi:hypothetical protein
VRLGAPSCCGERTGRAEQGGGARGREGGRRERGREKEKKRKEKENGKEEKEEKKKGKKREKKRNQPADLAAATAAGRARALVGRGAAVGGMRHAEQEKEKDETVIDSDVRAEI